MGGINCRPENRGKAIVWFKVSFPFPESGRLGDGEAPGEAVCVGSPQQLPRQLSKGRRDLEVTS